MAAEANAVKAMEVAMEAMRATAKKSSSKRNGSKEAVAKEWKWQQK